MDYNTLKIIKEIKDMTRAVTEIKFGPPGSHILAVGGKDTEINIYTTNTKRKPVSE